MKKEYKEYNMNSLRNYTHNFTAYMTWYETEKV